MREIEKIVRERLGQKKFNPVNNQKHKRFDFSKNCKKNKNIINLFNEYKFRYNNEYEYETFDESGLSLDFYKGQATLSIEILNESIDWYQDVDCMYSKVCIEDYTGLGTVEIIINILEKYSNFIEVNRNNKIESILK